MSSDGDEDISRLRADLIKSIHSKQSGGKSSSVSPTYLAGSVEVNDRPTVAKMKATTKLDTDMDDLEELRRAALVTLKKSRDNSVAQTSVKNHTTNSVSSELPLLGNSASTYTSAVSAVAFHGQQLFYPPPPPLLVAASSFSQFSVPPPTYQPHFSNQHQNPFRALMRPMAPRSNLIVIQTATPPGEFRSSTSSNITGKLLLPQDRYSRGIANGEHGEEKRRHDKWSRYEDTSSSSSSSTSRSSTPEVSDSENDDESDRERESKKESGSIESMGTPLDENINRHFSDSAESSQDISYGGVVVDECVSEEDSNINVQNEAIDTSPDQPEVRLETTNGLRSRQHSSLQSDDDFLLEEPVHTIEFLDEPVDDNIVQQLVDDRTSTSDAVSTPEPFANQPTDSSLSSPVSKEKKKQELKSKMRAVQKQLEEIYRQKRHRSDHHRNIGRDKKQDRSDRNVSPRNTAKFVESEVAFSKKSDLGRSHQRSPGQRQHLSSVVALHSGDDRKHKITRTHLDSPVGNVHHNGDAIYDERRSDESRAKRPRWPKERNAPESDVMVRLAENDDSRQRLCLPRSGDLRRFLETKKEGSVSKRDIDRSASPSEKVISPKKRMGFEPTRTAIRNDEPVCNGATRDAVEGRRRISTPRDRAASWTKNQRDIFGETSQITVNGTIDQFEANGISQAGARYKTSGADTKEGTSRIGTKVKLRKRF